MTRLITFPLLILLLAGGQAHAATIFTLDPIQRTFTVLSENLTITGPAGSSNPASLYADVGLRGNANGTLTLSNGGVIYAGGAYFSFNQAKCVGCSAGTPPGGTFANSATVTTVSTAWNTTTTALLAMTGATSLGAYAGGTLLSGLYDATSITLNNSSITLSGNATDQFVIRVPTLSVTGSSSLLLTGGVLPENVILLYTGATAVAWSGSGAFNGTFIVSGDHNLTFDNGARINGQLISTGNANTTLITLTNGTAIEQVPEPATFTLSAAALAGLIARARRRR